MGAGLLEYLYWCEDMKLTPLLTVWDGLSLGQGPGDIITGDALDPYVEDVLNEIEVCVFSYCMSTHIIGSLTSVGSLFGGRNRRDTVLFERSWVIPSLSSFFT